MGDQYHARRDNKVMKTCAVCGGAIGTGLTLHHKGDPVHDHCHPHDARRTY